MVLYKVVNGKRTPLDIVGRSGGYGVDAKVEPQKWHTWNNSFPFQMTLKMFLENSTRKRGQSLNAAR